MNTRTETCPAAPALLNTVVMSVPLAPELASAVTWNLTSLSSVCVPPQGHPPPEAAASHCTHYQQTAQSRTLSACSGVCELTAL